MTDNPHMTWGDYNAIQRDEPTVFETLYMAEFYHPSISVGDDCEYLDGRGEWCAARVLDYLMEDRPVYVIEYVVACGQIRGARVGGARLRKP